jgi:hypothetical protein
MIKQIKKFLRRIGLLKYKVVYETIEEQPVEKEKHKGIKEFGWPDDIWNNRYRVKE